MYKLAMKRAGVLLEFWLDVCDLLRGGFSGKNKPNIEINMERNDSQL
jgi:hypothetical protein